MLCNKLEQIKSRSVKLAFNVAYTKLAARLPHIRKPSIKNILGAADRGFRGDIRIIELEVCGHDAVFPAFTRSPGCVIVSNSFTCAKVEASAPYVALADLFFREDIKICARSVITFNGITRVASSLINHSLHSIHISAFNGGKICLICQRKTLFRRFF